MSNRPGFTLEEALNITSQGAQWHKTEQMHLRDPQSPTPHLHVTNELNTILATITNKKPGEFPAFLIGTNAFVQTEEGVTYVSVPSGFENDHQIYAGITQDLIFLRVFAAQADTEDFSKDLGQEQITADPMTLKYEYILHYGSAGQVIQSRTMYETFDNDELLELVIRIFNDALLPNVFNSHQYEQLRAELRRFTHTVKDHQESSDQQDETRPDSAVDQG
jgi:hypothetical protein